jgi:hypothetical protein
MVIFELLLLPQNYEYNNSTTTTVVSEADWCGAKSLADKLKFEVDVQIVWPGYFSGKSSDHSRLLEKIQIIIFCRRRPPPPRLLHES